MAPQLSRFPRESDVLLVAMFLVIAVLPWLRRRDLLFAMGGAALFLAAAQTQKASRLDPAFAGDSMLTTVHVAGLPREDEHGFSFEATAPDDARLPDRFRLYWREPPVDVRTGDVWRFEIRLRRPRSASNPGGADFEAWATVQRLGASGYVVASHRNRLLDSGTSRGVERLRLGMSRRIDALPVREDARAVIAALTIGSRHAISTEQWERYAGTGTTHLMAISGLHVGLLAGAVYLAAASLLSLLAAPRPHETALVVALVAAAAYASISGFAVPARRALLMLGIATLCMLLRRRVSAARVLAWTVAIVVATDPLSSLSAGFRLSFAAVALLAWLSLERSSRSKMPSVVRGTVTLWRIQLLLLTGLLPISVLAFDRIAPLAPLVNLIAVPLFGFGTVPLALTGLLLGGPLAFLGDPLLWLAAQSIVLLEAAVGVASGAGGFRIGEISGPGWVLLMLPLVWALMPRGWPGRFVAWSALFGLAMWRPERPPAGCVDVAVLDVGQGQAVVVETRSHVLLYDTGPGYPDGGSAAERIVLPYLASRGIDHLDRIVVSHADLDHAGGLDAILADIEFDEITSGEPLDGVESARCRLGQSWSWDGIRFRILHPSGEEEGNEASCVVAIETGAETVLLTGDIERESELRLVANSLVPRADLVTVPHHGSRTSSTPEFVRAVSAQVAIASAGFENRWGFPKPDVVERWENGGAELLTTADSGAVFARVCGDGRPPAIREHREATWRAWRED